MRIRSLTAFAVRIPLKRTVRHASATRRHSDNLVVCCQLSDGTEGWGEGVPRDYVTGESIGGSAGQLRATPLADQLDGECRSWSDVLGLCQRFEPSTPDEDPRSCRSNALRCAVELSILDAFGRVFREPFSRVTWHCDEAAEIRRDRQQVRYSGAITAASARAEMISGLKMRLYGFAQCKVKVGVGDDETRLRRIRRLVGSRMDLRVDANEAWSPKEARVRMRSLARYGVSCFEQPVPHDEVDALAELRRELSVPVMLDESLTGLPDARRAIEHQTCDLFNIRLSKCGGFVNSLRLAALARSAGLGFQLGCHPGETGLLSAAGRHWAGSVDHIRYLEGSYDRHVVRESLIREDITFGYGGRAPALTGPGLGVTIDRPALQRLGQSLGHFRVS